jgi:hypothetical protein
MAEPDYAVVAIACNPSLLPALAATENLEIRLNPRYTSDPATIIVHALADEDAQAAATALGCVVTVIKTPQELSDQIDSAYAGLPVDPSLPDDDDDDDDGGIV